MSLDLEREFVLTIDAEREIFATPTGDGITVCLGVLDPVSGAIVELTQPELAELIDGLAALIRVSV